MVINCPTLIAPTLRTGEVAGPIAIDIAVVESAAAQASSFSAFRMIDPHTASLVMTGARTITSAQGRTQRRLQYELYACRLSSPRVGALVLLSRAARLTLATAEGDEQRQALSLCNALTRMNQRIGRPELRSPSWREELRDIEGRVGALESVVWSRKAGEIVWDALLRVDLRALLVWEPMEKVMTGMRWLSQNGHKVEGDRSWLLSKELLHEELNDWVVGAQIIADMRYPIFPGAAWRRVF